MNTFFWNKTPCSRAGFWRNGCLLRQGRKKQLSQKCQQTSTRLQGATSQEGARLPRWKMFAQKRLRKPHRSKKQRSSKTTGNCTRYSTVSIRSRWDIWSLKPLLVQIPVLPGYVTKESLHIGCCSSGVKKRGWLLIETDKAWPLRSVIWF